MVEASGSYSLVVVCGLLTVVASLVAEHGPRGCTGFSSCGTRAQQCGSQSLQHRLNSCDALA